MPSWIDDSELAKSWMGPWSGLYHCATCGALISGDKCTLCGWELPHEEVKFIDKNGVERTMPQSIVAGAIPYTTHLFLGMMQREWERPLHADHWMDQQPGGPPQRSTIVMLFWTHFEFLMERFFDSAMADYPERVSDDLLRRYSQIGARLERLYKVIFGTTFWDDLEAQGDGVIAAHLREIQKRRNAFTHGDPQALTDALIRNTVERLHETQEAWIRIYNRRCVGRSRRTHIWDVDTK